MRGENDCIFHELDFLPETVALMTLLSKELVAGGNNSQSMSKLEEHLY